MSTIYIPQRIDTAEQAEALPHGAILQVAFTINLDPTEYIEATAFKAGDVWWSDGKTIAASELVGWTALVPIEAEEEASGYIMYGGRGQETYTGTRTRLVTPWEEA